MQRIVELVIVMPRHAQEKSVLCHRFRTFSVVSLGDGLRKAKTEPWQDADLIHALAGTATFSDMSFETRPSLHAEYHLNVPVSRRGEAYASLYFLQLHGLASLSSKVGEVTCRCGNKFQPLSIFGGMGNCFYLVKNA